MSEVIISIPFQSSKSDGEEKATDRHSVSGAKDRLREKMEEMRDCTQRENRNNVFTTFFYNDFIARGKKKNRRRE